MKHYLSFFASALIAIGCNNTDSAGDFTGVFEATEVIVSSEAGGQIISFAAEEGSKISKGDTLIHIDCQGIELEKQKAIAGLSAISLKQNDAAPQLELINSQILSAQQQINVLQEQLNVATIEQNRVQKLVNLKAVPEKQLDDINGQVAIINKQISAAQAQKNALNQQNSTTSQQIAIQNRGIKSELKPMQESIAIVNNRLQKCNVINPLNGTLLIKYAEQSEITMPGKPLYKVADLDNMILRAYASASHLEKIKVGQSVEVLVDQGKDKYKTYTGKITWISSEAEFTPKTIQTKEERSNLVYALKINVKNDSFLKLGMYGEVKLKND